MSKYLDYLQTLVDQVDEEEAPPPTRQRPRSAHLTLLQKLSDQLEHPDPALAKDAQWIHDIFDEYKQSPEVQFGEVWAELKRIRQNLDSKNERLVRLEQELSYLRKEMSTFNGDLRDAQIKRQDKLMVAGGLFLLCYWILFHGWG